VTNVLTYKHTNGRTKLSKKVFKNSLRILILKILSMRHVPRPQIIQQKRRQIFSLVKFTEKQASGP
jgi:hypothetical protein